MLQCQLQTSRRLRAGDTEVAAKGRPARADASHAMAPPEKEERARDEQREIRPPRRSACEATDDAPRRASLNLPEGPSG